MLIRPTVDGAYECTAQAHHGLQSGVLAAAWQPTRLDGLLVQTIGLHDDPWRSADAAPRFNAQTGLPHDFITFPQDAKITFYRRGIDALEKVHPYAAYIVSRHYTTFSGTRDTRRLTEPEAKRRERLAPQIAPARLRAADEAMQWLKYFDVFSLYLCLTGPARRGEGGPAWLAPERWAEAPDGTRLELGWVDDHTVAVEPWPFGEQAGGEGLSVDVHLRKMAGAAEDLDAFGALWNAAPNTKRALRLMAR